MEFYNPVLIKFYNGSFMDIGQLIESVAKNAKKILLVIGKNSLEKNGYMKSISEQLNNRETIIIKATNNPDISDIYKLLSHGNFDDIDVIVAIGGGSVIDTGKAMKTFVNSEFTSIDDIRKSINNKLYNQNIMDIPFLAVPTTAGTGSDVTSWATLWDKEKNVKYSIEDQKIYPMISIIDPSITLNMPIKITIATALDALSHAIEAYWSRRTSEEVREYSLKAIKLILDNIEEVIINDCIRVREALMKGSLFAGLAFSNTKTTACHSISYPLTYLFGVRHGIASSMTLGSLLKINDNKIIDKDKLLASLSIENSDDLYFKLRRICNSVGISFNLKDYIGEKRNILLIADKAFVPERMNNNPVKLDKQRVIEVLEGIY